jgi:hypothetical protein
MIPPSSYLSIFSISIFNPRSLQFLIREERYDQVPAVHSTEGATLPTMPRYKEPIEEPGTWIFRDIPRTLMQRAKAAAAIQGKTVKGLAIE